MEHLSRVWFALFGAILVLLASGLVIAGMYQVTSSVLRSGEMINQRLLSAVGYVVIAVAVFDVAKYLLEEEVIRERELRQVGEVRRSLTRFTSTILIAVLLEAIVLIFKMAEDDVTLMIYPTILLLAGVAMLVGLGVFQRMAVSAEHATGEHEDDAGHTKPKRAQAKPG
jgi:Ni,Fe-hydrogenase I cytochrome b subunit